MLCKLSRIGLWYVWTWLWGSASNSVRNAMYHAAVKVLCSCILRKNHASYSQWGWLMYDCWLSQAYKSWSCDCLLPFKLSQDAGQVAAGNDAKNLANRFKILFCDTYFLCNTIVSFLCGSRGVGYQSYLSSVICVWVFIYLFIFLCTRNKLLCWNLE